MQTTLDVLVAARALIAKPENWCQNAFLRNVDGGIAYCARGAIAYGVGDTYETAVPALAAALPLEWDAHDAFSRVAMFNNSHTHADVLALFDRAIAAERQKLGLVGDRIILQVQALLASALTPAQAPAPEPVL